MIYHDRLRSLRDERTQDEIARYLDIAQNTYSQYENGVRELPVDVVIKLAKFYKVSTDYILGLTDKK